jgi:hypothetical protein
MARKTIDVSMMVDRVNKALATSTCPPDSRMGMITVLEIMLQEASCYKGYRPLHEDEVPQGHLPAIRMAEDGSMLPYPERFVNCDDTRRRYF